MRRAVAAAQQAHLVLHIADASSSTAAGDGASGAVAEDEGPPLLPIAPHAVHMCVLNKADLLGPSVTAAAADAVAAQLDAVTPGSHSRTSCKDRTAAAPSATAASASPLAAPAAAGARTSVHVISCHTRQGIEQLLAALREQVLALVGQSGDAGFAGVLVTRVRHR